MSEVPLYQYQKPDGNLVAGSAGVLLTRTTWLNLSDKVYLLLRFRKSTPLQNRRLIFFIRARIPCTRSKTAFCRRAVDEDDSHRQNLGRLVSFNGYHSHVRCGEEAT